MSKGNHESDPGISALLRLKNYESPPDEYFEQFSRELREHQRSDALKGSSFSLFLERLLAWLDLLGKPRLAYGVAAAYAVLAIVLVIGLRQNQGANVKTNPFMESSPVSIRPIEPKPVVPVIETVSEAERERIANEKARAAAAAREN